MIPEMTLLLRLQELDAGTRRLSMQTRSSKEQLEKLAADSAKRQSALKKLAADLQMITDRRKRAEEELRRHEQDAKRFSSQVTAVKTEKELAAVNHEVEMAQSAASKSEEEALIALEEEEKRTAELAEKTTASQRLDAKAMDEREKLEFIIQQNTELESGLREDRITTANQVSEESLRHYEWLLSRHGPTAVAHLAGESCGGCGQMLVLSLVLEVRQNTHLVKCPSCDRFLIP